MPRRFFGYIRVSTQKQGERGVSLQEQQNAILRYAARQQVELSRWFEERETAAKRGRPVFNEMLQLLRRGRAEGAIVHKVDRSARNLADWAQLGTLIDEGIDVRFANEDLDLRTRSGRLTADIQAVVAADYIRNLREETRKGIYGRLRQGIYPFPAPLGYLDRGGGKPKDVDAATATHIRVAFELYDSGHFNLDTLRARLHERGLRTKTGGLVSLNGLSRILRNPFYAGLIRLRSSGETFSGVHEPVVGAELFRRVQERLDGRLPQARNCQEFTFRRLIRCGTCGYALIGERQKGHVYYRCHTRTCPTTGIREAEVDDATVKLFRRIAPTDREHEYLATRARKLEAERIHVEEQQRAARLLRSRQLSERLERLTDAFLDQSLDRETFVRRKEQLLLDLRANGTGHEPPFTQAELAERIQAVLQLAKDGPRLYSAASGKRKRELLETVTSNRELRGKSLVFTTVSPFTELEKLQAVPGGDPPRNRTVRSCWSSASPAQ